MSPVDLAREMEAARQRRNEQTARALRDARVVAVRAATRPGATPAEIEEVTRSFYPRLSPELLAEVTAMVSEGQRGRVSAAVAEEVEPEPLP